jgi:hypothetical protein
MIYVFDSNSLITLGQFYPSRFPTLWTAIDEMVANGDLVSVREVYRELHLYADTDAISEWAERNKHIFLPPEPIEARFVTKVLGVPHFRSLISKQSMLEGKPVADPFVIAAAKHFPGTVVTEERYRPNAAKVPNVCRHFGVPCINLEQFMDTQGWTF